MKKIFNLIYIIFGIILGINLFLKIFQKKIIKREKDIYRFQSYFHMFKCWVKVKQKNIDIAEYIYEKGYKNIAIYGMGEIGSVFYDEIKNSVVNVKYGIDKIDDIRFENLTIVNPSDNLENVDAIIVTPVSAFDEIREMLEKNIDCKIIALDDLIYELS